MYSGQDKGNSRHRNRFEHFREKYTFVTFVLKPHYIDSFLDDGVVIHPLSRSVSVEGHILA
jgi:hypothetical protein